MSMDEDANSSEEEGAGFQAPPDTEAKCWISSLKSK